MWWRQVSRVGSIASLPALKMRIATEIPHLPGWGIHVMVFQNTSGGLGVGDSQEYGKNPQSSDKAEINCYILNYLKGFAAVPSFEIAETWHGVYVKSLGKTEWIEHLQASVAVVNALARAGYLCRLAS